VQRISGDKLLKNEIDIFLMNYSQGNFSRKTLQKDYQKNQWNNQDR
jgi:hypothetical protein